MRFFIHDFDKGHITEYERVGHCNQCGQCCRISDTIHWVNYTPSKNGNETAEQLGNCYDGFNRMFLKGQWVEIEDDDGKKRYYREHYFKVPLGQVSFACPMLRDGDHCSVQGEKSQVSKDYPYHPSQTDLPFSRCSYRFVSLGQRIMAKHEKAIE